MNVEITVQGADGQERRMALLAERLEDPTEGLQRVATALRTAEATWFTSRGGGRWPALAQSTIRRHGAHPPLRLTGRLLASLTRPGGSHVERVRGDVLQFGTKLPTANLVAGRRPVLDTTSPTRRRIGQVVGDYLLEDVT